MSSAACAIIVGLYVILGVAALALVVLNDIKNMKRETCRCCSVPLPRPGGRAIVWVGPGFCNKCVAAILKSRR